MRYFIFINKKKHKLKLNIHSLIPTLEKEPVFYKRFFFSLNVTFFYYKIVYVKGSQTFYIS